MTSPRPFHDIRGLIGQMPKPDEARAALAEFGAPDVIIADYHLDSGDGVAAIRALREDLGRSVAAILATADRSPEVRDEAEREDILVMNKPLKPALSGAADTYTQCAKRQADRKLKSVRSHRTRATR